MKEIAPDRVLYIKLGRRGNWEHECIYKANCLKLGYNEVPHDVCMRGDWEKAAESLEGVRSSKGVITRDINQIREFYEAGENVLWITFHENCLWWCFSKPEITLEADSRKSRSAIDKWRSTDIEGNLLSYDRLKASLVSIQGFRGAICSVKDSEFTINKINSKSDPDLIKAENSYIQLKKDVEHLIKRLYPSDFELLMDLIFRQAGWQRLGIVGGTQKTIDLDMYSPISREKFCIQVKSKSDLKEFEDYQERFKDMQGYSRFYFVVHSPSQDLQEAEETGEFKLMFLEEISELTIKYGLIKWLMDKF